MPSEISQMLPLDKILVSVDGSENSLRAVKAAIGVAKQFHSELIFLNVIEEMIHPIYSPIAVNPALDYSDYLERSETDAKKLVNGAVENAKRESVNAKAVVLTTMTSVPQTILDDAAKENVNLIVVGTRGLGGFKKLVLGSVSNAVIAHAHCSVLVIR
jgi:nucleotide-binding universal stress UspA family protein